MQMGATPGRASLAHQAQILCSPPGGNEKGLCCQRCEMIFVLQISHSLRSGRPIVGLLSSVGGVVVNRQLGMRLR